MGLFQLRKCPLCIIKWHNIIISRKSETVFRYIEGSAKDSQSEGDFAGLFDDFDVNSNKLGATVAKRNEKLVKLLVVVSNITLDRVLGR